MAYLEYANILYPLGCQFKKDEPDLRLSLMEIALWEPETNQS
jgi:hypothetical protein